MDSASPGPSSDGPQSTPQPSRDRPGESEENQIAALLQCRFGDGMDYFPRQVANRLLELAVRSGFVDEEGYLTRRGRSLLARHHFA